MRLIDADEMLYELTHWKDKKGWYHDNRTDVYHISEIKMVCDRMPSAQPDLSEFDAWFYIGETLVDVSKDHVSAEQGIEKIRGYLQRMKKPERQRGAWIEYIPGHGKCPFCCNQVDLLGGKANNFCGECGADLRGANHDRQD